MTIKELKEQHRDLKIMWSKKSVGFITSQNSKIKKLIIAKISYALSNRRSLIPLKGPKSTKYKIRIGDIRVICILEKIPKGIKILEIGHRSNI